MAAGRLPAQAAVVSTGSTSGGRPGCLSLRCVGRGWDRTHRPSGLSRWPQVGSQRRLRWSRRARPAVVGPGAFRCGASDGAGTGPTAHRACRDGRRSAPSAGCGGLDGLDQRWSARVPSLRCVGWGWDWTHRPSGLSRWPQVGSQRRLRWSRRARPAVVGPGAFVAVRRTGLGLDHRPSGLSRWPQVGSQRRLRWSRRARPAVVGPGAFVAVRRTGLGLDHRPSSLSRWPQVGSQRRLRWSRRARPAVVGPGAFVAVRRTGLGLDHPSIGPVEMAAGRLPAQAAVVSTGSTSGGRPGCLRCGGRTGLGLDRRPSSLSRWPQVGSQRRLRWSRRARPAVVGPGAFRCGASDGAGTGPPSIEPVEMAAGWAGATPGSPAPVRVV